jgi:hypothetical protein
VVRLFALLLFGLVMMVAPKATLAFTGCNVQTQLISPYGGVQNPQNKDDVCGGGNCRVFIVWLGCEEWCEVTVCFADYSWECNVPYSVYTNDNPPEIPCGHSKNVVTSCRRTGSSCAWSVCHVNCTAPCGSQTEDEDTKERSAADDIVNLPQNSGVKALIDNWCAGAWVDSTTTTIWCNCP